MRRLYPVAALAAFALSGCAAGQKTMMEQAVSANVTQKVESQYTGPKRRVGVVDFQNKTAYGARLGTATTDILITELVKSGKFIVVERDRMNKLMEEQRLGMTGAIDPKTAAQVGKILGLNAIITGAISQYGVSTTGADYFVGQTKKQIASCTVDIRVVDVETGQVIWADSGKGEATTSTGQVLGMGTRGSYNEVIEGEALRAAISKLVDNLTSQINRTQWYAKVLDVEGNDVFIGAGTESGLAEGTKLDVFHRGREIRDENNLVVGYIEDTLGAMLVDRHAGEKMSVGHMLGGARQPTKGDVVRLQKT
jgi:curli biogenesis system outer membrane secretion channel CsgG